MTTKTTWVIDPGHSTIQFKVKHLAIANVTGTFRSFNGYADTEGESFEGAKVYFEMDTASVDTNNTERDNHLKSGLFLDIVQFPKITFSGTLSKAGDGYLLQGGLTIRGTTKTISLEAEHTGIGAGRFNDTRAGFEVTGKINRKDFGLDINLVGGAGNLVVGEDIKFQIDAELIKQKYGLPGGSIRG